MAVPPQKIQTGKLDVPDVPYDARHDKPLEAVGSAELDFWEGGVCGLHAEALVVDVHARSRREFFGRDAGVLH